MAEQALDLELHFDLLDGTLADSHGTVLEMLTEDEKNEVENVVTLLKSAENNSLEEFDLETSLVRHKRISESELDRLARKNSAQATCYQTKWALVVMKDK